MRIFALTLKNWNILIIPFKESIILLKLYQIFTPHSPVARVDKQLYRPVKSYRWRNPYP